MTATTKQQDAFEELSRGGGFYNHIGQQLSTTAVSAPFTYFDQIETLNAAFSTTFWQGLDDPALEPGYHATATLGTQVLYQGYQDVDITSPIITGSTPVPIPGTYDIDISIDGGLAVTYTFSLVGTETASQVATIITAAIGGPATVSIVGSSFRFMSATLGSPSAIVISIPTVGINPDFISSLSGFLGWTYVLQPPTQTNSFHSVDYDTSTPGTRLVNLLAGNYGFSVDFDGGGTNVYVVSIVGGEDFNAVVSLMQTAIGGNGTVSLVGNTIRITTASMGFGASVTITKPSIGVDPDLFDEIATAISGTTVGADIIAVRNQILNAMPEYKNDWYVIKGRKETPEEDPLYALNKIPGISSGSTAGSLIEHTNKYFGHQRTNGSYFYYKGGLPPLLSRLAHARSVDEFMNSLGQTAYPIGVPNSTYFAVTFPLIDQAPYLNASVSKISTNTWYQEVVGTIAGSIDTEVQTIATYYDVTLPAAHPTLLTTITTNLPQIISAVNAITTYTDFDALWDPTWINDIDSEYTIAITADPAKTAERIKIDQQIHQENLRYYGHSFVMLNQGSVSTGYYQYKNDPNTYAVLQQCSSPTMLLALNEVVTF
jgi:hypothetical protein